MNHHYKMASLWTTHVLEPGKTYDELNPNEKRPFTDDEQGSVQEKMNEHVLNTVNKYLDHVHAGKDSRRFEENQIAYMIVGDNCEKVRIIREEEGDVVYFKASLLQKERILELKIKRIEDEEEEVEIEDASALLNKLEEDLKNVQAKMVYGQRKGKRFFILEEDYIKLVAVAKDEEQHLKMQQNKTYQFVMLLASYTNEKVEKFFDPHDSKSVHTRMLGASGSGISINRTNRPSLDGATQSLTKWYHNIEWADGLVHLTPMIYGHIEEAYTVIKQKWAHLRHVPLHKFTDSLDVRSMFARLVAMGIRTSDVLSGRRYHLQSTYSRVNMEKMRLINYWHQVKYTGTDLVYDPSPSGVDQISTIQQQFAGVATEDLFKFTKDVKRMNNVNNLYTF